MREQKGLIFVAPQGSIFLLLWRIFTWFMAIFLQWNLLEKISLFSLKRNWSLIQCEDELFCNFTRFFCQSQDDKNSSFDKHFRLKFVFRVFLPKNEQKYKISQLKINQALVFRSHFGYFLVIFRSLFGSFWSLKIFLTFFWLFSQFFESFICLKMAENLILKQRKPSTQSRISTWFSRNGNWPLSHTELWVMLHCNQRQTSC